MNQTNKWYNQVKEIEAEYYAKFPWEAKYKRKEVKQMAKLKDEALGYEPPQTKNIADLDVVPVDVDIVDREGIDKEGKKFSYKAVVVDEVEYRIPNVVIGDLKAILEKNPNLSKFSVTKKGQSLQTRYTVIPIQ